MNDNSQRRCHSATTRARRELMMQWLPVGLRINAWVRRYATGFVLLSVMLAGGVSCQRASSDVAQGPQDGGARKVRPVAPRPLKPRPTERPEEPGEGTAEKNAERNNVEQPTDGKLDANTEKTQPVDSDAEKLVPEKPVAEKEKPTPEKPAGEKPAPEKPAPEKPERLRAKLVPSRKARPLAAPDEPVRQPRVAISDYHRATSLLALGDKLPDFELADLYGDTHSRRSLLTEPLTVLVFWNSSAPSSRDQFTRLPQEIWDRFGDARVATVAVHVGPSEADLEKLAAASKVEFPVLLDAERKFYSQVAKSRLPRTLLVNQAGEVLWMDLEYSRSMRRELVNAIYFHLSKQSAAAKK